MVEVNPRERYAGWVAPLCWLAVALEGFDLVVSGVVYGGRVPFTFPP